MPLLIDVGHETLCGGLQLSEKANTDRFTKALARRSTGNPLDVDECAVLPSTMAED